MADDQHTSASPQVLLAEYQHLKSEQVERIKLRDSYVNLNIVAVGVISGFLASHPRYSLAWLAVPWICTAFGWLYVMNDEKVSALQRYFRTRLRPALAPDALGWEIFDRRKTILKRTHKGGQLVVEEAMFVLPTVVALVAYASATGSRPWFASTLAVIELAGGVALAVMIWARSDLVTRFDATDETARDA